MKNLGSMNLKKGTFGDSNVSLIMWDALPDCNDECSIWESCPYEKNRAKCEMRRQYVTSVINQLEKAIQIKDETSILKMGLLLMPLFNHLVDFKITHHALNGDTIIFNRGSAKIHPVYKEIRATVKMINEMLNDLGVSREDKKRGMLDGDSDYYETMVRNGEVPE